MTITQPGRRGLALAVSGLLTVGLMMSLSPQWAHAAPADAPAAPPDKAPTTTINNLSIPAATTTQKSPSSASATPSASTTPQSTPTTSGKQAAPRTAHKQVERRSATTPTPSQSDPSDSESSASTSEQVIADLPATSTKEFSMVGVTWLPGSTGASQADVQVRTRPVDGSWTDWTALDHDADANAADSTRVGTAPTFVGESNAVQVRVTGSSSTDLKDLQLNLIDSPVVASDQNPQTIAAEPQAATAASSTLPYRYPRPSIISRKGWGADESLRSYNGKDCATPRIDPTIEAVVIHHTAGSNSYTKAQSASIVRGIYAYHVKTHGWCDIGYNFLVDRFGQIFEGRFGGVTVPVHGAHATLWNTDTAGVSLMGNFNLAKPTTAMIEATEKLAAWKLEGYYRNPQSKVTLAGKTEYRIFSHGDVMQTDCPGRYLHAMLGTIRANVAAKIGSYNTPIYRKWQSLGGESGWVGSPHVGETATATGGRYTFFQGADIYYRADFGTHYVKGAIRRAYNIYGGRTSKLGYPIADEHKSYSPGSYVSHFNTANIYWSKKTGAYTVWGALGKTYRAMKEDSSKLGLPTANEKRGPVPGAWMQTFSGGWLVWTSAGGGHELWGGIGARYRGLSSANKAKLGAPTTNEASGPVSGAWSQTFSGGYIIWSGDHGAQIVWGAIGQTYRKLSSADKARLGVPTRMEYKDASGRWIQPFTNGSIIWSNATGHVQYN